MAISPFIWGASGAVPWDQYQRQQADLSPIDSPLQGLGMMAQALSQNLRGDARNYFPGSDGGFSFNPWARMTSGGGLY